MTKETIIQAVNALKAGDQKKAWELFATAIQHDPNNELAWSWMYSLVDTDEKRIHCLKEVLRINPANEKARKALENLEGRYTQPPDFESTPPGLEQPPRSYVGPIVDIPATPAKAHDAPIQRSPDVSYVGPVVESPREPSSTQRPIAGTQPVVRYVGPVANPPGAPTAQGVPPSTNPVPYPYPVPVLPPFFTAKRMITAIGLFLIIIATLLTWQTRINREGALFLVYNTYFTAGYSTPNGIVSAVSGLFGIALLFGIKREKKAHFWGTVCAIISAISAAIFLSEVVGSNYNQWGTMEYSSRASVGVYMVILGAVITLFCFLIPAQEK